MNRLALLLPLLLATLLAACTGKSGVRGGALDTTPLPNGETLSESDVKDIVTRGAALYWSFREMQTAGRGTGKARDLMMIDPAKFKTLKELRRTIATVFTTAAADSMLADYRVLEQDGKLWMRAADADDVRDFDLASVPELSSDSTGATAKVEVPLGESGQSDLIAVRLRKTPEGWKIANYIFDDEPVGDEDDDSAADTN